MKSGTQPLVSSGRVDWRDYPIQVRAIHRRVQRWAARTAVIYVIVPATAASAWLAAGASHVLAWGIAALLLLVSIWATRLVLERLSNFRCRILIAFDRDWSGTSRSPVFPGIWLKLHLLDSAVGAALIGQLYRLDGILASKGEIPLVDFVTTVEQLVKEDAFSESGRGVASIQCLLRVLNEDDALRAELTIFGEALASAAHEHARFALVVVDDDDYWHMIMGRAGD